MPLPPKPAAQRSRAAQVASAASIPPIEVTYNYAHDYSEGPSSASAYVLPETGYGGLAPMGGPSGTPLSGPPSPYYPQPDYRASLSPSLPPFQTQWPSQGSSASPSYDQAPSPLPFPQPSVGGPASSEFFPRYDIPAPFGTMRSLGLFAKNDAIPAGVVPAAAPVAPVAPTQAMPPVPGNAHLASVETRTSNGTSKRKSAPPGNAAVATAAVNVERTDSVTEFTALQGSTVIPIPKHQPGLFDDLPPMPPQECLNELVTLYFDYVHHYQPFLHRHTVLRAFSSLPALLQLSIYAAAASFSKDSRIVAMNLYNRAKAQYKMEMDRPSHFQTTQSMLLIIHAVVRTGAGSQAVFWAGQILQMVRHLHLFADPDLPSRRSVPRGFVSFQDLDNMTWIEKESERRTFWAALMVDKLSATAINSFCSIKEDDIFVSLPCHDLIWEADLPAQVDVDPTGIPISVLLNEDPEPPVAPAATMSSHGGLDLNNESLMRYTSGVSQPSGPFAHTARQYVLYGKLLDHRVKCRNRNMSHLADPELSVAIHGWRSQLPSWVLELDEKGIPGTPKLGEDVRWGYSALIMHHYMMSLLFGPGEFRDWVGEKFFSEEAGLLWVTSSMMLKCIDGMKRVSRMMSVVRSRNEDPDILDLGGPFLPYCFFQLGMVGLVALRALSLGIISLDLTGDQIKAVIEVFIWALQKHGKTNRTGHRLAIHLAKLLSDVCEFNGQFPAVDMVERMQQRKIGGCLLSFQSCGGRT